MKGRRISISFSGFVALLFVISAAFLGAITSVNGDAISSDQAEAFGAYSCCGDATCGTLKSGYACPNGGSCSHSDYGYRTCCSLACNEAEELAGDENLDFGLAYGSLVN